MRTIDYRKFLDRNLIGHLPLIGGGLSLVVSDGVYRGAYLEQLLTGLLADLGCAPSATCAPAKSPNSSPGRWSLPPVTCPTPAGSHPMGSRVLWHRPGQLLRGTCGTCIVGDSLRLRTGPGGWRHVVDGGLLSNFPVELFDRPDAQPRWPTFGIRLSARPGIPPTHPVHGPVSLGLAAIETLVSNQDNSYIDDPCTVRRTIFVPATT